MTICFLLKNCGWAAEVGTNLSEPDCTQSHPRFLAKMGGIVASLLNREKFTGHRTQHTSENYQLGLKLGDA